MKTTSNKVDRTAHKLRPPEVITHPRYGYDVRPTWTCLDCNRQIKGDAGVKEHTAICRVSAFRKVDA